MIWKNKARIKNQFLFAVSAGIGGAIVGLLVNGAYIDIFEASKVAYPFWAMMGVLFAIFKMSEPMKEEK